MSEHKARITWKRSTEGFDYETYNREHDWNFPGGEILKASAAPEFKGKAQCVNPEEALVAAVSSCHMLTFLAMAAKKKMTLVSYEDNAVGHLEKNAEGMLAITRIELFPKTVFETGIDVSADKLQSLHEAAHHHCFIANSVKTGVTVHPS